MIPNLSAIRAYRRPANLMIFRRAETPLDRTHTKLGGLPYLLENERWPVCRSCRQPMTFIFQAMLGDIPPGNFRIGRYDLLTFYYCLGCRPRGSHEQAGYDLRLRQTARGDALQVAAFAMHDPDKPEPQECAVVFRTVEDLPPAEKIVGIIGTDEETIGEYERHIEGIRGGTLRASKVGGYPYWLQTQPTIRCKCGATMRYLAQIGSSPELDVVWCGNGVLYLFHCPEACSKEAVGFSIQHD